MANPKGNLAGWSDRAEEGWEQRALERVRLRMQTSQRSMDRNNGIYLFFDDPFRVYLDEAARRRDISLTGYGRRAVGAFLAHDLDLDLTEVLRHTARPVGYMKSRGGAFTRSEDDGSGHGLWVIDGLVEP